MSHKHRIAKVLSLVQVICLFALFLPGCMPGYRGDAASVVSRPDPAEVIGSQEAKDTTVLSEAAAIDLIAPAARLHTDAQRAAVASAPAADVVAKIAEYERALDRLQKQNAALAEKVEKLRDVELRWQGRALTGIGIACFVGFGLSFFGGIGAFITMKKTWPLPVMGFGALGAAQIVTHPYFKIVIAGLLLLGAGYTIYWIIDRKRKGRLDEALSKRTDALRQIVPVLENAKNEASGALGSLLQNHVFDVLRDTMSRGQKDEVKAIKDEMKGAAQ